jgi:putative FmdB family regulatory protein
MPIFEYSCKKCGQISEILTGVTSDESETKCAHCGSKAITKKFTVANFSVRGASIRAEAPPCGAARGETCGHCQYAD